MSCSQDTTSIPPSSTYSDTQPPPSSFHSDTNSIPPSSTHTDTQPPPSPSHSNTKSIPTSPTPSNTKSPSSSTHTDTKSIPTSSTHSDTRSIPPPSTHSDTNSIPTLHRSGSSPTMQGGYSFTPLNSQNYSRVATVPSSFIATSLTRGLSSAMKEITLQLIVFCWIVLALLHSSCCTWFSCDWNIMRVIVNSLSSRTIAFLLSKRHLASKKSVYTLEIHRLETYTIDS